MGNVVYGIVLAVGLIMIAELLITLSPAKIRFWPLEGSRTKKYSVWFFIAVFYVFLLLFLGFFFTRLTILTWYKVLGLILFFGGLVFFIWSLLSLRWR